MSEKITIYWDGSCGFCRKQVDKIRSEDTQQRFEFVPTNTTPQLYLKDPEGHMHYGADAFGVIWKLTGHPILSLLCRAPISRQIAQIVYWLIAKHRHQSCEI